MGHFSINLTILGGNKQTGQRICHKSINFIHSVGEYEWFFLLVHKAIVKDHGLKDCPSFQLQLLTALDEPLDQHLTHLLK